MGQGTLEQALILELMTKTVTEPGKIGLVQEPAPTLRST